jgi:hypothetical protein
MTLRQAQIFFSLCGDGGANAAAGVVSKGQEQHFSHSYGTSIARNSRGLKMFVNILRKEAKQSLHLIRCFAFLFMMSQCRNRHASLCHARNSAPSEVRTGSHFIFAACFRTQDQHSLSRRKVLPNGKTAYSQYASLRSVG